MFWKTLKLLIFGLPPVAPMQVWKLKTLGNVIILKIDDNKVTVAQKQNNNLIEKVISMYEIVFRGELLSFNQPQELPKLIEVQDEN